MSLKEELDVIEAKLEVIDAQRKELHTKQRDVYRRSLEAAEEDKVAKDSLAAMMSEDMFPVREIEYPLQINGIAWDDRVPPVWENRMTEPGKWVKVRPCDKEYEGKTYLGVMLGAMALSMTARQNPETGILHLSHGRHNPAMYVPDLKKVIFGMGSWWGAVESPEDLKSISDADIENVWYVRALKELDG